MVQRDGKLKFMRLVVIRGRDEIERKPGKTFQESSKVLMKR